MARKTPVFRSDAPPTTWDGFLDLPLPDGAHPIGIALALSQAGAKQMGYEKFFGVSADINPYTVGAAMLGALARYEGPPLSRDAVVPAAEAEQDGGTRLMVHALGIVDPVVRSDRQTPESLDRIWGVLLGGVCSYAALQGHLWTDIARAQVLLGEQPYGSLPQEPSLVRGLIEEDLGANFGMVMAILIAAVSRAAELPIINLPDYVENEGRRDEILTSFRNMAEKLACPVQDVRRVIYEDFARGSTLESRTYTFWMRHPLVDLGGDYFLLAPHAFLRQSLGTGLLFLMRQVAQTRHRRPDNPVSQMLGTRFQTYVGEVLKARGDAIEIHHEFHYSSAHATRLSPDHTVFDKGLKTHVLHVEVKSTRLSLDTFLGSGLSSLKTEIRRKFCEPIVQVIEYLHNLSAEREGGTIHERARHLVDRILDTEQHTVLVVVPHLPPVFQFRDVRRAVIESALARLSDETREWFDEWRKRRPFKWHILGVHEIEVYAGMKTRHGLGSVLRRYLRAIRGQVPVDDKGMTNSFVDHLRSLARGRLDMRNPRMLAVVNGLFDQAADALGREMPRRPTDLSTGPSPGEGE